MCSPGPGARSHGEQRSTPVCPRGTGFSPTSTTMVQPFFPLRSLSLPSSSSSFISPHLLTPFSPLSPRPTPLLSPSGQCPAPRGAEDRSPQKGMEGRLLGPWQSWRLCGCSSGGLESEGGQRTLSSTQSLLERASSEAWAPSCVGLFFAEDTF